MEIKKSEVTSDFFIFCVVNRIDETILLYKLPFSTGVRKLISLSSIINWLILMPVTTKILYALLCGKTLMTWFRNRFWRHFLFNFISPHRRHSP